MATAIASREQQAAWLRVLAAHLALCWVLVFLGLHVYWYLGGSFASPGKLPGEPMSLTAWAFNVLVDGTFALGFLVPLAIARGWARGRLAKPVAILAWLGCAILVLRGAAGLIDDLTRAAGLLPGGITGLSTEQTTGSAALTWSGWAIDAYFLIGGLIFGLLACRYRARRLRA
jgi:hypothetical protein